MGALFYKNKRVFTLVILMLLATGLSTLSTIGRQEDPTITNLFATIVTPYPGADPSRVEALVTEKIEQELRKIPEIDEIKSTSRTGISVVSIELSQFISDVKIEQTWSEIRDALSDAAKNFPIGIPEPDFDNDRAGTFTAISAITPVKGREINHAIMKRYAETLRDRLRGMSGTKLVALYGERKEEVRVEINHRKLVSYGLTIDQVSNAIKSADSKVRSGQIRGNQSNLLIEVSGEIKSTERINVIPIIQNSDGTIVRISDIATVKKTYEQPAQSLAYTNGIPAVLIAARMDDNLQVDAWMKRVQKVYDSFESELPKGLKHEQLFDQSHYTQDRLANVLTNMGIGAALVIIVLIITLGWRSAFIVAVTLPLASLISISGLQLVGIPIHQMSVTGLIVALGLLVDAAIVMTDEIRKLLEKGLERLEAVKQSISRLTVPLLASTVTTTLAFTPMMLLPGPAGDFVGSIAISVIIMLLASFFLSITITPALSGWFLKRKNPTGKESWLSHGIQPKLLSKIFNKSIYLSLLHPRLAILGALVLPIIGFGSFPTLKAQFFPGVDRDQFYLQVKLPNGSSINATRDAVMQADKILKATKGIEDVHWVIGESAPAFYYNMTSDQDGEASFAEALIKTSSPKQTELIIPDLQRRFDRGLTNARVIVRGLVQGPPVNAPVEIRVVGPNTKMLREIGDQIRNVMVGLPEVTQAKTELTGGEPKIIAKLNEEKVHLTRLDLNSIASQLETTFEGMTGGSLIEDTEELPIRVRINQDGRSQVDVLRGYDLLSPQSKQLTDRGQYPGIPLVTLGTIKIEPSKTPIFRRNGERINTIQAFVHRNILPEEALKLIQLRLEDKNIDIPKGYRLEVGGDSDARNEVLNNLLAPLGLIISLTIATIVLTFNSFRLATITMIVAVLSMGLSLLALAIFDYPFGIQAVIGVIGSIGVSINAAIIIMTALQQNPDAVVGNIADITRIVSAQSRHIISTTITTFGGFLPLIIEGGGFWPPFAMSIAGGVLLSTVVSLYFTPPAFLLFMRQKKGTQERSINILTPELKHQT